MADINSPANYSQSPSSNEQTAHEETANNHSRDGNSGSGDSNSACGPGNEMVGFAELLFFAYRDFTADADVILLEYGFGRAHHRVLHFVARNPGLRVADLLEILKITKQSLARVLKQLLDQNIITQKAGKQDRRERRLYATAQGTALMQRLSTPQCERINKALAAAGPESSDIVKKFLFAMIKRVDRAKVETYLNSSENKNSAKLTAGQGRKNTNVDQEKG